MILGAETASIGLFSTLAGIFSDHRAVFIVLTYVSILLYLYSLYYYDSEDQKIHDIKEAFEDSDTQRKAFEKMMISIKAICDANASKFYDLDLLAWESNKEQIWTYEHVGTMCCKAIHEILGVLYGANADFSISYEILINE